MAKRTKKPEKVARSHEEFVNRFLPGLAERNRPSSQEVTWGLGEGTTSAIRKMERALKRETKKQGRTS